MHTEGFLAPGTTAEAREAYEHAGPAAQVVVRETARAMGFDGEEYRERVTSEVVGSARDALFASLLRVTVGSREEFETWRDGFDGEVVEAGNEHVDRVVWHAVPFAGTAVAATFQNEKRAAVQTLRRQAFGRIYRDRVVDGDTREDNEDAGDAVGDDAGGGPHVADGASGGDEP